MGETEGGKKKVTPPYFKSTTPTFLRGLVTVYVTALAFGAWTTALILQVLAYPFAYLLLDKYSRITFLGSIFRRVNVLFVCWLNPFWRVELVGKPTPKWDGPRIAMCNHLSNSDPWFLCSQLMPNETKYIVKGSLFKVPIGGWAMALAGDIPIHFTSAKGGWGTKKGSIGKMMRHCKDLIQNGLSIAVFPEGIRSKSGKLSPFKDGMFMLAVETDTPIVPCALSGSGKCWPVSDAFVDINKVYCAIGDPISAMGKTVEQLKEEVKKEILRLKNTFPAHTLEPKETYVAPKESSAAEKVNGEHLNGGTNGVTRRS